MRLQPLYRLRFAYPEGWEVRFGDELAGAEGVHLYIAEGRAEGAVEGRFRGLNHPRRRGDGTFEPDFQGVVETGDGAVLLVELRGYGRAYPLGRRQIVVAITHLSDDERYRRLNDVVCVGVGEVRSRAGRSPSTTSIRPSSSPAPGRPPLPLYIVAPAQHEVGDDDRDEG